TAARAFPPGGAAVREPGAAHALPQRGRRRGAGHAVLRRRHPGRAAALLRRLRRCPGGRQPGTHRRPQRAGAGPAGQARGRRSAHLQFRRDHRTAGGAGGGRSYSRRPRPRLHHLRTAGRSRTHASHGVCRHRHHRPRTRGAGPHACGRQPHPALSRAGGSSGRHCCSAATPVFDASGAVAHSCAGFQPAVATVPRLATQGSTRTQGSKLMSTAGPKGDTAATTPPEFPQVMGHPRPLWMLFMAEFWERFAFYGMRWALTLYIVAQFFGGDASGEAYAGRTYGAYLALVYASAIFGGYVADRVIGYQRSILVGAVFMSAGLFMIMIPNQQVFLLGLATIIIGNGLFKPNISTMVGQLYTQGDSRRDRGFTIFYMGINAGALISPLLTGWLAEQVFGTPMEQNYKAVFAASGIGMLVSLLWFWIGRRQLQGIGRPAADQENRMRVVWVVLGAIAAIPVAWVLMAKAGATILAWLLGLLFIGLAVALLIEAFRNGTVQTHRVVAMLIIFTFNVMFWMFFEQAGSSFNFLAQNIVDRDF